MPNLLCVASKTVLPAAAAAAAGVCCCLLVGRKAHRSMLVSAEETKVVAGARTQHVRASLCLSSAVWAPVCKHTACAVLSLPEGLLTQPCLDMLHALVSVRPAGLQTCSALLRDRNTATVRAQHRPPPVASQATLGKVPCPLQALLSSLGCPSSTDCRGALQCSWAFPPLLCW